MNSEVKKPEFTKGDTDPSGDCGKFEAGIHHLTHDDNVMTPVGPGTNVDRPAHDWWQRIVVYGSSPEQAEALRDRVLFALKAQPSGVVLPDRVAMAKALCKHHAEQCGVNADDQWKVYSENFFEDVDVMLAAAPAAPAADAGLSLAEWTKDAEAWGGALNDAGWLFLSELNEDPQKSALIFNNTKGPLRAAIMKYAEIVAANAKDSSHAQ